MSEIRAWDGTSYDRISGVMQGMGEAVLARLELTGDETVIDAGCGSGRVTELLVERLPRGRVIALDASRSMLEAARERLAAPIEAGQVELLECDLVELELAEPVDAVLSTATFHWVPDHERLFEGLHTALHPGGQLVAQCGGEGNIDVLRGRAREVMGREPYASHFESFQPPWNYAPPQLTEERLGKAGFAQARAWLEPSPQQPEEPHAFLSTIVLGPHVQHLPEELRVPFMDEVLELLGEPVVVDYVRLNIAAVA